MMAVRHIVHKIVFAFLTCCPGSMAWYVCAASAAEHTPLLSQTENGCPCSTCSQRWFSSWFRRVHPYTQNEEKFALLVGLLFQVQQKDAHSKQVKYPLVELVFDYYNAEQEWVEMTPLQGCILPNNRPNGVTYFAAIVPNLRYAHRVDIPLATQDAKFSEADVQAMDNVICERKGGAEVLSLCKQYKVIARINCASYFDCLIERYYALPTKQRVFALMEHYHKKHNNWASSCLIL